jgi:hypothetical protein
MNKEQFKTLITENIIGTLVGLENTGALNDDEGNIDIDKIYASLDDSIEQIMEDTIWDM